MLAALRDARLLSGWFMAGSVIVTPIDRIWHLMVTVVSKVFFNAANPDTWALVCMQACLVG